MGSGYQAAYGTQVDQTSGVDDYAVLPLLHWPPQVLLYLACLAKSLALAIPSPTLSATFSSSFVLSYQTWPWPPELSFNFIKKKSENITPLNAN